VKFSRYSLLTSALLITTSEERQVHLLLPATAFDIFRVRLKALTISAYSARSSIITLFQNSVTIILYSYLATIYNLLLINLTTIRFKYLEPIMPVLPYLSSILTSTSHESPLQESSKSHLQHQHHSRNMCTRKPYVRTKEGEESYRKLLNDAKEKDAIVEAGVKYV